jgi:hypothetical protein
MPIQSDTESKRALPGRPGQTPDLPHFDPMEAIRWSFDWCRSDITKVPLPVIVHETIILFATLIVPKVLGSTLGAPPNTAHRVGEWTLAGFVQHTSATLLGLVTTAYAAAALYPYLINVARGRPVAFSEALGRGTHYLSVLKLVGIFALAAALSVLLCALPTILIFALSTIALPAAVDRDLEPRSAIFLAIEHVRANPVQLPIFGLLCIAITLIGAAVCFVGAIFVSVPIVMLAQVHVYLHLQGETPVPADVT